MTVEELIKELEKYPKELPVSVRETGRQNAYSVIAVSEERFFTWGGYTTEVVVEHI